jgi:Xaa-Pro aminopeptidase
MPGETQQQSVVLSLTSIYGQWEFFMMLTPRYPDRLARLRALLIEQNLDAILVSQPESRYYLSGFAAAEHGTDSAGRLLISMEQAILVTDGRYAEQSAHEAPGFAVVLRQADAAPTIAETIRQHGWKTIGFEAEHLTVAVAHDIRNATGAGCTFTPTRGLVESLRLIKDDTEVAALRRAQEITDETFRWLLTYLRPGLVERTIAWAINQHMVELSADAPSFPPIVASGPNAALPHAVASLRPIAAGEPITIDMGARYQGYCADMTRTVCLGRPDDRLVHIYDIVLAAQEACEAGIHAGMTGKEADTLARDVIERAGYGEQFMHGTGHGIGLEIHEAPRLNRFAEQYVLADHTTITVEPGIYIPDWGGVRIEDCGLVTAEGYQPFTRSTKTLQIAL